MPLRFLRESISFCPICTNNDYILCPGKDILMKKFAENIVYGANITGGEGGATNIVCDNLGNNIHHALSEVDLNGAVVKDTEGRFHILGLADLRGNGVVVFRGANDIPRIDPGKKETFSVGLHTVTIEGTNSPGVLFNGKPSI